MCDIDEILNEEAKHLVIQEDDLCEQQDYRFVAIVDVYRAYRAPFVELSQKMKFFRFDIATGQFMPALWGSEYQNLTGKRIRRMFCDEALAMSKNMFEFFCSNKQNG